MAAERVAVCIARLQPLQRRHAAILEALGREYARVLVVCGGVTQPPSIVNPWSLDERRRMLALALPAAPGLALLPVADCWYDDLRWAAAVRAAVAADCAARGRDPADLAITCCALERAGAGYYARLFPDWLPRELSGPSFVDALPEALLGADAAAALTAHVPPALQDWLAETLADPLRGELREEYAFTRDYRDAWRAAPFPPVFVTVDALVTHREHVLLVRRGHRPGRGLLALPGGFIDVTEPLGDSAVRELREETGLALAADSYLSGRVFDHPLRSLRGRTITHLYRFVVDAASARPPLVAGDDAAEALWLSRGDLRARDFFEDHYAMLQVELGLP
jgi:bifunctional NMN adenylyltransferase/nudix hydrolase